MLELCEQKPGKDKAAAQATQQEAISSGDRDSQTIPLKKVKSMTILKVHHQLVITIIQVFGCRFEREIP